MKYTVCDNCHTNNIPLNETLTIDTRIYCSNCIEKKFPTEESIRGRLVEKEQDPTVCSSCNKDFGSLILNKIASHPVCDECEIKIQKKVFPKWVQAFFAAVVVITITGFVWNWKYYTAYSDIKKGNQYFEKGDYAHASAAYTAAGKKVPESEDLALLTAYFSGIDLLSKDKSAEALTELNKCKNKLSETYGISRLITQATIGASFDSKDYRGFLKAARENLQYDSTNATSLTCVASAYACIYANENSTEARSQAWHYLGKAQAVDDTSKEMRAYYNMVEYRIDSKKIIRREEFEKQFPNGWKKNP